MAGVGFYVAVGGDAICVEGFDVDGGVGDDVGRAIGVGQIPFGDPDERSPRVWSVTPPYSVVLALSSDESLLFSSIHGVDDELK